MSLECLTHKYYFEDEEFSELFKNTRYVWEAVTRIKEFVKDPRNLEGKFLRQEEYNKGIYIGRNTQVEKGARIKPPTIIGLNCEIRSGVYIRGNVVIGDNCVVRTEIKNSVIMNNTKVAHPGYIGDSIIGSNCNFGINISLANLRICNGNVKVKVNENVYDTDLRKFGAIIGDNVSIGSNCVLSPGTLVGKNVIIYPLTSLRGYLPSNSIVKLRQELDLSKYIENTSLSHSN